MVGLRGGGSLQLTRGGGWLESAELPAGELRGSVDDDDPRVAVRANNATPVSDDNRAVAKTGSGPM